MTADPGEARTYASFAATHALPIGTRLRDYEITGVVGAGRVAIVYRAFDHSLQRQVAVKEYAPSELAGRAAGSSAIAVTATRHREAFKAGLKAFVDEARWLARFDHPSLVKVYRFWAENSTAYTVMPFYEESTLRAALVELGHVPGEAEVRTWLRPLLDAVGLLHGAGVWHRNISPDTIVQTSFGPVLLGFEAAAHAIASAHDTPAAALRPGFAAIEQYRGTDGERVGPWTDLYALGAVVYSAITGSDPMPAPERLPEDRLRPLAIVAAGLYDERFLAAIDAALAVVPPRRPSSHEELRAAIGAMDVAESLTLAPPADLMDEPFLGSTAGDDEITVPDHPLLITAVAAEPAGRRPFESRPAPLVRPAPVPSPAAQDERPVEPSWLTPRAPRHRWAPAVMVAVVCALIALAAFFALQLSARPDARSQAASTPARTEVRMPPVSAAASAAAPVETSPRPATLGASTTSTSAAAAAAAPASAPPPAASFAAPPALGAASVAALVAAPLTARDRQARCTELLQRASLERIAPADTEFFKKECR